MRQYYRNAVTALSFAVAIIATTVCVSAQPERSQLAPGPGVKGIAYLGAFLGDVTEERARELKLENTRGVIVGKVADDSPAAKAGIREGDVILMFRNDQIENREHFYRLITEAPPGRIVTLSLSRNGEHLRVHVPLGARVGPDLLEREQLFDEANSMKLESERLAADAEKARAQGDETGAKNLSDLSKEMLRQSEERREFIENQLKEGALPDPGSARLRNQGRLASRTMLGVSLLVLTDQLAAFFGVEQKAGLLVTEVKPGGIIERAGIKAGDCITAVNGEKVTSFTELSLLISKANGQATFHIVRDRADMSLKAPLADK